MMLTIGKIARRANVSADTLRYYERENLLTPSAKSDGGYRLYDHDCVRRVDFIRHAQQCGFTLAEIRELLSLRVVSGVCCAEVRNRVIEKKLQVLGKIKSLQAISRTLDDLVEGCGCGEAPANECTILQALDGPGSHDTRPPRP